MTSEAINLNSPQEALQADLVRRSLSIKFFGVGGAGGHVTDYLSAAGFADVNFVAINTDARALADNRVPDKIQLGASLTRGLGTGGDPELGWAAAEQAAGELGRICHGADIVFLAAGLGGGTGTGASPVLARVAKEAGALVLGFVILPFDCEGNRRRHQALRGLQQLEAVADGVICMPNQRLSKLVDENTSLVETF
ncbi:MAG: cell division protein FtsZ, partial [Candidatus Omnitrophica bacterium]|nr:cell division protein FtsZ [Candidatus Omnitrophota bacterium]